MVLLTPKVLLTPHELYGTFTPDVAKMRTSKLTSGCDVLGVARMCVVGTTLFEGLYSDNNFPK